MTYDELIQFFGDAQKTALAIGKSPQTLSLWNKKQKIHIDAQCYIEVVTQGKFKADRSLLPKIDFKSGVITPPQAKLKIKKSDSQACV